MKIATQAKLIKNHKKLMRHNRTNYLIIKNKIATGEKKPPTNKNIYKSNNLDYVIKETKQRFLDNENKYRTLFNYKK